jgi:uncharacterized protein YggE
MKKAVFFLMCLISECGIRAEPELKGTPAELSAYLSSIQRTVIIHGEAEVRVPADKAIVQIKVSTENRSLQDALRLNEEARTRLLNLFKRHGFPQERIQAARFSSTPKFGIFSEKAKSYRVENIVKVTVLDEKEFQVAAGAVDAAPELQFAGVEFEHADKDSAKAKVVGLACENASQRKDLYEQKLGLKLTPAKFSEGQVVQKTPLVLRQGYNERIYAKSAGAATGLPAADTVEESITPFGEMVYSVEVAIEYLVQPK